MSVLFFSPQPSRQGGTLPRIAQKQVLRRHSNISTQKNTAEQWVNAQVCVFSAKGRGHDGRPPWEHEQAHIEDTLQRQKREMQMDEEWLEQEERQLVGTHTPSCCVFLLERTGHSFSFCVNVESYGATKLTRQGTLAVRFILSTSSKDTSVSVFNLFAPWTVKPTCTIVCRTRPCDRTPTSRYVRAFGFMLPQDGL